MKQRAYQLQVRIGEGQWSDVGDIQRGRLNAVRFVRKNKDALADKEWQLVTVFRRGKVETASTLVVTESR